MESANRTVVGGACGHAALRQRAVSACRLGLWHHDCGEWQCSWRSVSNPEEVSHHCCCCTATAVVSHHCCCCTVTVAVSRLTGAISRCPESVALLEAFIAQKHSQMIADGGAHNSPNRQYRVVDRWLRQLRTWICLLSWLISMKSTLCGCAGHSCYSRPPHWCCCIR